MVTKEHIVGFVLGACLWTLAWLAIRIVQLHRQRRTVLSPKPVVKEPARGGCGVRGCPNMRPYSHAMDLARRLNEDRAREKAREHAERKAVRETLQKAGKL